MTDDLSTLRRTFAQAWHSVEDVFPPRGVRVEAKTYFGPGREVNHGPVVLLDGIWVSELGLLPALKQRPTHWREFRP